MKSIHTCNTGIIFASLWNTVTKMKIGRTNLYFWQRIAHNILNVKPNTSTSISLIQVEMNANPFFEILVQKRIFPAFIHVYPICINFKGPILMTFECIIWWNHELIHSGPPVHNTSKDSSRFEITQYIHTLNIGVQLNWIQKISSHLTENPLCVHHKDKCANSV